jgi:hypothetical protein
MYSIAWWSELLEYVHSMVLWCKCHASKILICWGPIPTRGRPMQLYIHTSSLRHLSCFHPKWLTQNYQVWIPSVGYHYPVWDWTHRYRVKQSQRQKCNNRTWATGALSSMNGAARLINEASPTPTNLSNKNLDNDHAIRRLALNVS